MLSRKRGVTLLDLSLAVLLLGILFGTAFRLLEVQRKALQVCKENNLALFILEGQRNRILSDLEAGKPFDERVTRGLLQMIPYPWNLTGELKLKTTSPGGEVIELSLNVPSRQGMPGKKYLREIRMNP